MSEKTFKFYIGDESRVVIEDSEKKNESIFSEVYAKVFDVMNDSFAYIFDDDEKRNEFEIIVDDNPCISNIFAFTGDRGTGKTSCMMSVAKMLQENEIVDEGNKHFTNFKGKKFEVLDSTDPSFFTETKNILEIFVGRLFSRFKIYVQKFDYAKENEKNVVFEAFERVKESLTFMDKEHLCEDGTVEQLMELGASVDLQKNIQVLINCFLKYVNKDFLVIPVDDIDLHTIHAFRMAEQIRKYLTLKNTIILMALKTEQLEYAVERHYLDHYKDMIEKNFFDGSKISDMASKYMIKLIPQARRFALKTVEELVNEPVEIIDNGKKIPFKERILKDIITSLIFKKTRYLFYHYKKGDCPIIPHTLREVRHLIDFLYRMPNYNEKEDGRYNKRQFENYFFEQWALHNCDANGCELLKGLYKYQDVESFNKHVVQSLSKLFGIKDERPYYRSDDSDESNNLNVILNKGNVSRNISLGDVFAFIHYCEVVSTNKQAFFFGLKFIYSIRLCSYYNKLVEEHDKEKIENSSLRKDVARDAFSDYNILVGGAFFNFDGLSVDTQMSRKRFDYRAISIDEIRKTLSSCLDENLGIKNMMMFNVVEFYALSLSRKYYWENEVLYRKTEDVVYNSKYLADDYAIFDTLSIFSNITDVKRSYERVDDRLWNAAEQCENSLYKKIKFSCEEKRRNSQNPFLSCCCIRNIDILESLQATLYDTNLYIQSSLPSENNDELCYSEIKNVYNKMNSFSKDTYDRNDENSHFIINFIFLQVVYESLQKEEFKKSFLDIFSFSQKEKKRRINQVKVSLSNVGLEPFGSRLSLMALIQELPFNKSMPLIRRLVDEEAFSIFRTYRDSESRKEKFVNEFESILESLPVID